MNEILYCHPLCSQCITKTYSHVCGKATCSEKENYRIQTQLLFLKEKRVIRAKDNEKVEKILRNKDEPLAFFSNICIECLRETNSNIKCITMAICSLHKFTKEIREENDKRLKESELFD